MSLKCEQIAAVNLKCKPHRHMDKSDIKKPCVFFNAVSNGFISPGEVQDVIWKSQLQGTKHATAEAS